MRRPDQSDALAISDICSCRAAYIAANRYSNAGASAYQYGNFDSRTHLNACANIDSTTNFDAYIDANVYAGTNRNIYINRHTGSNVYACLYVNPRAYFYGDCNGSCNLYGRGYFNVNSNACAYINRNTSA